MFLSVENLEKLTWSQTHAQGKKINFHGISLKEALFLYLLFSCMMRCF
jgi:hypothetical protein